jgi:potassium-transporting ATPase KdpC subunit
MMKDIIATLRLVALTLIVCCVLYPAVLLAFGQVCLPWRANGSLIRNERGVVVGSALIAQGFTRPHYFWPRPSAVNYDASAAGGSNLSPTNPALTERARATIQRYAPTEGQLIPADLVAASGSGLDPHITIEAARFQAPRVAAARGLALDTVNRLIDEQARAASIRLFGEQPLVNVLTLNLALDKLPPAVGK